MSRFELEAYDASRRDAYLGLLREVWGEGAMRGDVFDWWFAGNPEGSLMSVATVDGEVVGVASHSLARIRLDAELRLAQYSVHAATSEKARGLGIFRALERRHEELGKELGSACVLAFASAPTRPLFLGPLGWSQIDRRRVWGKPLTTALARRLRRRDGLVPSAAPPVGPDGGSTVAITRFGGAQEGAYEALAPRLGHHVVRSARYLQWRYLDSPRPYLAFASPDGFAVLGSAPRGRLVAGLVLELVAPPGQAGSLLSRCAREARGVDILLAVPSPLLPQKVLLRHGFVPLPTRLDFMGLGLARPLPPRGDAWALALGDTDFF